MEIGDPIERDRVDVFQYDVLLYQNSVAVVLNAKLVIFRKLAKSIFYYFRALVLKKIQICFALKVFILTFVTVNGTKT